MKNTIRWISLFLMVSCSQARSGNDAVLNWQPEKIIIDGSGEEWQLPLRFFEKDVKMSYEFRNDAENLYMIMISPDQMMQMKQLRAGMEIKFKTKSKSGIEAVITIYPYPMEEKRGKTQDQKPGGFPGKETLKADQFTVTGQGFYFSNGAILLNSENIAIAVNNDENDQLVYEIKIPLRELFGKDYQLEEISEVNLNAQIKINALKKPEMSERGNGGPGEGGFGGGGRPDGGMGGPPPQGGQGGGRPEGRPDESMFEQQTFNQSFQLAKGE